ncbi:MAG: diguanylate cyclase [Sulfurospirillaceae bacterium]|nr:diguanylate cyclase [Sulfurospirillaceae bacterium]MDD2825575.1 diguanylate cyclase [Sulfurospirillaceae bacterium]
MKFIKWHLCIVTLLLTSLCSETMTSSFDTNLTLSASEKNWLAKHPVIRVGMDSDYAPFEWLNEKGQYVGMAVDYLALIEKKVGVHFEIVKNISWTQAIEMTKKGEIDMLSSIVETPERLKDFIFSEPYRDIQTVIVDNAEGDFIGTLKRLHGKRVVVEKGYFTQELIEQNYSDIILVLAKNTLEALTMVCDGKVDAYVGDISSTNYTIIRYGLKNLRFSGQTDFMNQHRFGVAKSNRELATILSKVMHVISPEETDAIFNRWMSVRIEQGIALKTVVSYSVIFLLFLFLLGFWTLRLQREIKLRKASEIAYKEQSEELQSIIIEKNHAEAKLKEREAYYRHLTEDVSDVIWKADKNLIITYISPSDERLRGYKMEEVIGRHVFEMFTQEGIETIMGAIRKREEAEKKGIKTDFVTYEIQHRCKDGRLIWGEILSKAEFNEQREVIGYHGITREVTERKMMQAKVEQLAFYDTLTTLPNRLLLSERLTLSVVSSKRNNKYCALIFLDLDNFKSLNDTHGHSIGDRLLIEVSHRLKGCVREVDTVSRFGGDEFVIILQDLHAENGLSKELAKKVAEKIRISLSKPYHLSISKTDITSHIIEHYCTASIGIVLFKSDSDSKDELLKKADKAMYQAKEAGKNTIEFYESDTSQ